jgi:GDPmannose 4,6-dehydratase
LLEHLPGLGYEVHGLVRKVALDEAQHRKSRIQDHLARVTIHLANVDTYASVFHVFSGMNLMNVIIAR